MKKSKNILFTLALFAGLVLIGVTIFIGTVMGEKPVMNTEIEAGINTEQSDLNTSESGYTFLTYTTEWWWIFENAKPSELNVVELDKVNLLIQKAIKKNNLERKNFVEVVNSHLERKGIEKTGFELDLKRYRRQYVTVINELGEKEIWINFFCKQNENFDWRKEPIVVADGGSCYFNLKVNLTKEEYYNLRINGVA